MIIIKTLFNLTTKLWAFRPLIIADNSSSIHYMYNSCPTLNKTHIVKILFKLDVAEGKTYRKSAMGASLAMVGGSIPSRGSFE